MTRIEVHSPIRWINLRRHEVGSVISERNVKTAMKRGMGNLALYVEDFRQQRVGLFLCDVCYRLHTCFKLLDKTENPASIRKCSKAESAMPSTRIQFVRFR